MKDFIKAFFSGLSSNEKKILYAACAVVCLALLDRLVFNPMFREIDMLNERIKTETNLIKGDVHMLNYRDKIVDKYIRFGKYFAPEGLTQDERIAAFLNEIEALAKRSSTALTNINPVNVEKEEEDVVYRLTIECLGTMSNLVEFMYGIESAQKMIRVVSYTITPKNREEYETKAVLTIEKRLIFPLDESVLT